jgi:hypothetical protein
VTFLRNSAGQAAQSHLDFGMRAGTTLKGHRFSRAKTWRKKRTGFSRWGMFLERRPIHQGLKAGDIQQDVPRHD